MTAHIEGPDPRRLSVRPIRFRAFYTLSRSIGEIDLVTLYQTAAAFVAVTIVCRLLAAQFNAQFRVFFLQFMIVYTFVTLGTLVLFLRVRRVVTRDARCNFQMFLIPPLVYLLFFWETGLIQSLVNAVIQMVALIILTDGLVDQTVRGYSVRHPVIHPDICNALLHRLNARWQNSLYRANVTQVCALFAAWLAVHYLLISGATIRPPVAAWSVLLFWITIELLASWKVYSWHAKLDGENSGGDSQQFAQKLLWNSLNDAVGYYPNERAQEELRLVHPAFRFFDGFPLVLLLAIFVASTLPAAAYFPVHLIFPRIANEFATLAADESNASPQPKLLSSFRQRVNASPEAWPFELSFNAFLQADKVIYLIFALFLCIFVPVRLCFRMCFILSIPALFDLAQVHYSVLYEESQGD